MEIRLTGTKEEIEMMLKKYMVLPENLFTVSKHYQNGNSDEYRVYINFKK